MRRDATTLQNTTKMVRDFACDTLYRLPASSFQKIAQDILRHKKAGDGSWIARALLRERKRLTIARKNSHDQDYAPFTNLGNYTYRWLSEQYAAWVLPLMAERLDKPEDIYPAWAVQFADALDALGWKACKKEEELYKFVTTSKAWEEAIPARMEYLKDFKLHREKYKQKKRQSSRPQKRPSRKTFYRAK